MPHEVRLAKSEAMDDSVGRIRNPVIPHLVQNPKTQAGRPESSSHCHERPKLCHAQLKHGTCRPTSAHRHAELLCPARPCERGSATANKMKLAHNSSSWTPSQNLAGLTVLMHSPCKAQAAEAAPRGNPTSRIELWLTLHHQQHLPPPLHHLFEAPGSFVIATTRHRTQPE